MTSDLSQQTASGRAEAHLRPVTSEDEAFLYQVYASTRGEELASWGWDKTQQELFLKMQFKARDQSYRMYYPELDDRIILFKDQEVGRLIVNRTEERIRLVDIALLPEYRRAGIGTSLIKELCAEAAHKELPIGLEVLKSNGAAASLYLRLGFSMTGESGIYFQMEWRPGNL